ncbi:protein kinase [Aeoliella sp. ICT_H6.2]|uniref:Protein kinase n=1 Tax=Aeoliella straminimaris TaxID=2954799 RepID=A0A9X2F622_9BACT|nr:protein kinase [Aeoliella straminimaris]MCO6042429.1 protein kinase [Aeoliella straminimaris]
MSDPPNCPSCGVKLPSDAPAGLCPKCLVAAGMESEADVRTDLPMSDSEAATIDSPSPACGFMPPRPAEWAGKFPQLEILEMLGHGGMGAVYLARQTNLDRLVALKIIRPEATHDPLFAERFNREAKTLARLTHQHIVGVYDFGEIDYAEVGDQSVRPLYYFLMEYVDGANLRQLIQSGELTPEQALAIVPQVCNALQHAHDEGVVHRDIKPENILLDKRGRVKIADFGLAKLTTRSEAEFTLTGTHQVMGTLRYMAPEQLDGSHAVDHRADIYSLGVVFYEMLTGEAPIGHFEVPSKKAQIDVRLDQVVLRSLAREPERRYQHASDVKTDVESISETTHQIQPQRMPNAAVGESDKMEAARRYVQRPAVGLMVVGALSTLTQIIAGIAVCLWIVDQLREASQSFPLVLIAVPIIALLGINFLLSLIIAFGAWSMLRLSSLGWATAACALALLPLPAGPFWILSLPISIWALVVLSKPDVRHAFQQAASAARSTAEQIRWPSRLLIMAGVINLGQAILCTGQYLQHVPPPQIRWQILGIFIVTPIVLAVLQIVSGLQIKRFDAFELAVTASAVSLLPLSLAAAIGIPAGIWALAVLFNSDVRREFKLRNLAAEQKQTGPTRGNEADGLPRLSHKAVVGAILATISAVAGAVTVYGLMGDPPPLDWPFVLSFWLALLTGLASAFVGAMALHDFRYSARRIIGIEIAFFDIVFFPLALLDGTIFAITYFVVSAINPNWKLPDAAISLVISLVICIPVNIWIVFRTWRAIRGGPGVLMDD